jgi:hypothetical protein
MAFKKLDPVLTLAVHAGCVSRTINSRHIQTERQSDRHARDDFAVSEGFDAWDSWVSHAFLTTSSSHKYTAQTNPLYMDQEALATAMRGHRRWRANVRTN